MTVNEQGIYRPGDAKILRRLGKPGKETKD
jgi:hypothetical protein